MDLVLVNIFGSQTGAGLAYAIVIVQLLLFLALGLNQWLLHRAGRQVEWLRVREKAHLVLSLGGQVPALLADLRRVIGLTEARGPALSPRSG